MRPKWRPPLGLVVAAILLTVLALPLVGLLLFRLQENRLLLSAALAVAATFLIGYVFVRTITRPMRDLMDRAARIMAGDGGALAPIPHHGTREMAELAGSFLEMARQLQARSEAIRIFATHLSHELKSPLAAIKGAAELLQDAGPEMDAAARSRFHANIIDDADRLNRLMRRLLELARAENTLPAGETASLAEALNLLPTEPPLPVDLGKGAELRFRMSAENAAIALGHLLDNAARHGASRLTLSAVEHEAHVSITVTDDGTGVSPGNQARIFEPFFTTRREAGGTGLGLGIVQALAGAHGGTIALVPSASGASFNIVLPAAP